MVAWRSWYRIWRSWRDILETLEMSVLCVILVRGRCVVERERPSNEVLRVFKDRFSNSFQRSREVSEDGQVAWFPTRSHIRFKLQRSPRRTQNPDEP